MKKWLITSIAVVGISGAASAADFRLPVTKAPVLVPVFSWTGAYVGVNLGYGTGTDDRGEGFQRFDSHDCCDNGLAQGWSLPSNLKGITGGGQIGFNYQYLPWLVFGAEVDYQGAKLSSRESTGTSQVPITDQFSGFPNNPPDQWLSSSLSVEQKVKWWSTFRARVGMPLFNERLLAYGTAGFAFGRVTHQFDKIDTLLDGSENPGATSLFAGSRTLDSVQVGYAAGFGLEWAMLQNWSVRAEYLLVDLGTKTLDMTSQLVQENNPETFDPHFTASHTAKTRFNAIRGALNYHF